MRDDCIVSIIIPVFNMAGYLDQTIGSWTDQTLKDIEIILVDDASTDDSLSTLREWEKKDARVRVYAFSTNKSAWSARLLGVREARGQYIMFADADDTIEPDACEILYNEMQRSPVDILHFGTNLINVNGLPEARTSYLERFLLPYNGTLHGKDVLLKCFRDGEYGFTLWNKFFSARVCKQAFEDQDEAVLPRSQDKLAFFLFAYYAGSYRGLKGKPLYNYYFGRGGSGYERISEARFEIFCSMSLVANKLDAFLKKEKVEDEYRDVRMRFRKEMLADCVSKWQHQVSEADKGHYFDILINHWPAEEVIGLISESEGIDKYRVAKQLKNADALKRKPGQVRTIATYYPSTANGGIERAMSGLCRIWVDSGYNVILLTEMEASDRDYEFPDEVQRIVMPDLKKETADAVMKRAAFFTQTIQKYRIDLVVYHAWMLNTILWDELAIKLSGAAFIMHCHGAFSTEMAVPGRGMRNIVAPSINADAVVALSDVDRRFWLRFNPNVFTVINPFSGDFNDWKVSDCDGHDIVWVARISPEKQPFDALAIMQMVFRAVPDARFHIVGSGWDHNYELKFIHAINQSGVKDRIILHGFQLDVMPYYEKGSVFLMTSEFEGYPLVLQEAMMSGLPIVMYELPHLTLAQNNPGIIAVPQKDTEEAARAIIDLLNDDEKRKHQGHEARKFIVSLKDYDFKTVWNEIFNSVLIEHMQELPENEIILMETMVAHSSVGFEKNKDGMVYARRKTVRAAVKILKIKDNIHEHGLKYTLMQEFKALRAHLSMRRESRKR